MVEKMPLNKYQKFCYDHFGQFAERKVTEKLKEQLAAAHIEMRGAAYWSWAVVNTLLVFVVTFVVFALLVFFILPLIGINLDLWLMVFFMMIPALCAAGTFGGSLAMPASRAKARGKKIDLHLPYAINFISAMASAGITPADIFKSLSKQDIYGEIKEEAAWIYRDVAILGSDIITAIKANIQRTPSQKFKEFLQGMVVTVASGGSLKSYFMNKANQYMWENRQSQKQMLESLGIMAESYVTAAVAGILLLLIVIPLMMIISGNFNAMFLYILIFMVLPMIHSGFAVVIKSMAQGA